MLQEAWRWVDKSRFCLYYKQIKPELLRDLRCERVVIKGNKCKGCLEMEEQMNHILGMSENWKSWQNGQGQNKKKKVENLGG